MADVRSAPKKPAVFADAGLSRKRNQTLCGVRTRHHLNWLEVVIELEGDCIR